MISENKDLLQTKTTRAFKDVPLHISLNLAEKTVRLLYYVSAMLIEVTQI